MLAAHLCLRTRHDSGTQFKRIFVVMVGDGVTDLEARPPADVFIGAEAAIEHCVDYFLTGYGGVTERERVRQGADFYVTDFATLIEFERDDSSHGPVSI